MTTTDEAAPLKTTVIVPPTLALLPYLEKGASRELATALYWFEREMKQRQHAILVYCVYRSPREQARIYAQGRTAPGHIVTYARPGQSAHNRTINDLPASDAFDACPLIDGKPDWRTTGPTLKIWDEMGEVALGLGLQWGRQYKNLGGDWAHFQYPRKHLST